MIRTRINPRFDPCRKMKNANVDMTLYQRRAFCSPQIDQVIETLSPFNDDASFKRVWRKDGRTDSSLNRRRLCLNIRGQFSDVDDLRDFSKLKRFVVVVSFHTESGVTKRKKS